MRKKIYFLSLIFFVIDFISKLLVLKMDNPIMIINNFFYLEMVTNTGAAFSILRGNVFLFIIIGIIAIIYIDRCLIKDVKGYFQMIGVSMLIGGIIGNLYDRVVYHKVIDFLSFRFGSYNFPIFNLADSFICIGVLILIINSVRSELWK